MESLRRTSVRPTQQQVGVQEQELRLVDDEHRRAAFLDLAGDLGPDGA